MTERELLEKLVKAHGQWAIDREESFQEDLSTYDPVEGDQPCKDWEMGDYDEIDENYAYDARDTFISLAEEARKLLEMETA
ncbi:hypothetical protein [Streptomyces sp. NBC_01751]|uniref:hypothetical protein n=1 Tax=Streptomyces sp. NBC_01751 TaxID=2975929 RepID=UPI002DDB0B45|nr:hypothetical protein [Streptomyces sp. NBC_01751]WSD24568.1 hypothetical protein OHA26_14335 [Streptomyces sp. NBC_01751]